MATLQHTVASAVLELAHLIEPSIAAVIVWYVHIPIRELGNFSAWQLVEQGRPGERLSEGDLLQRARLRSIAGRARVVKGGKHEER